MQNPKHIYILSLKTVWRYPRGNSMTKTNKELQNTTQKDQATRTPPQTGGDI